MKKFRIKRFFILTITLVITIFGCSCDTSCEGELDPATFDSFTESLFQTLIGQDELTSNFLFEHPENFGLEHYEPSLPTPGVASDSGKVIINFYFGQIKRYDYNKLNDDQKMTYNLIVDLLDNINAKTAEMSYLSNNYLGTYLGYQAQLPLLLSEYKFRTKLDVENYFKFLDLVPETFTAYVEFEKEKADHGYGMPDFVIDNVVSQCENFISKVDSSEHFMIVAINKKIDDCSFLSDDEKANFKEINVQKVNGPLIAGYEYVKEHLPELKGRATNNQGLAHYVTKDGEEIGKKYYEIDFQDTVGYQISLEEAKDYINGKINNYLTELQKYQNLYRNDLEFKALVDQYDTGELKLMNTSPEEQLSYYQTAFDNYFPPLTTKPRINVKYIDPSMEDNFSPAAYMTSAVDNLEEEFIYLNNADIKDENGMLDYNYLFTTLAHEGYPGHLYQNVYFKNQDVNILRKVLKSSGYMEGWATYTEIFSFELLRGKYPDNFIDYLIFNEEYSGALYSRMDMGIHYDGWSKEEFTTFIRTYMNSSITEEKAQKAYEQLVEIPNNYQTYFFTYFKIKDLQQKVKELAGSKFDYQTFHKYILDCGPAPLRFVEEYVLSKYSNAEI